MARLRLTSDNLDDMKLELNNVLKKVETELNRLGGYAGDINMEARVVYSDDIIVDNPSKGLILKDDGNPPQYWRLWIDASDGSLNTDTVDPEFKD